MADTMPEDRAVFSAPYDGVTKVISIGFCVFQLILIAAIHNVFANAALILIGLITYAYSPQGYIVTKWDPLESTCRHASLSIL